MTGQTDADLLRRAAREMREKAQAASQGRWGIAGVDGMGWAVHRGEHDTISLYSQRQDAAHIASWDPPVALAVADWLEVAAGRIEWYLVNGGVPYIDDTYALAVARTYLGGDDE